MNKQIEMNKQIAEITRLAKLLKEEELTEIEVETDGFRIKLRKENQISTQTVVSAPSVPSNNGNMHSTNAPVVANDLYEVKSPMVGTYYSSPSPDMEPFVKIGGKVKKGDTLCIVEAMKLMNELPTEVAGEIVEICVNNSEAISYGQVLMKIKKTG